MPYAHDNNAQSDAAAPSHTGQSRHTRDHAQDFGTGTNPYAAFPAEPQGPNPAAAAPEAENKENFTPGPSFNSTGGCSN